MKPVEVSRLVGEFVRQQAPDSRKALRAALRKLEKEQGDIRALDGPLKSYWRLRVRTFRVIFVMDDGVIRCLFAERRSVVYQIFEQMLKRGLLGK